MAKRQYNQVDDPQEFLVTEYYDWKPSPRPVPVPGICDEPCKCAKINVQWLDVIIPAILRVGHSDLWQGAESDRNRAHDEVNKLIGMIMACDCGDGGKDTAQVEVVYDITTVNTWIQEGATNYATYTTTNPDLIGDGQGDPATTTEPVLTREALCYLSQWIAETFRQFMLTATTEIVREKERSTAQKFYDDALDLILQAGVAIAPIGVSLGILVPQAGVVAAFLYGAYKSIDLIFDEINGTGTVVVEGVDLGNEWVENMACYLLNCLDGQSLTYTKWLSCATDLNDTIQFFFDAVGTTLGAFAADVWIEFVRPKQAYFGMVELIDKFATASALTGVAIPCDCCDNQDAAALPSEFFSWSTMPVGWTGDNVFQHEANFGVQVGSTGAGHPIIEYPQGYFTMRFSERIRVQRIRIGMCRPGTWPTGGNYPIHAKTACFEKVSDNWNEIAGFCDNGTQVDISFPSPGLTTGKHETPFITVSKGKESNVPPLRVYGVWLYYEYVP